MNTTTKSAPTTNWPPVPAPAAKPAAPAPLTPADRDRLLADWLLAKQTLDTAKETEMQLRLELNERLFDPGKVAGTMNHDLGNGYKLKCERKQYYNLANKDVLKVREQLAPDVAERIFREKYELSISEFKLLKEKASDGDEFAKQELRLIEDILTVTPGTPSLTLVEPKAKKGSNGHV